ncbi:MAG: FAD-dependent oxidoreductase [Thermodesulfobacteriota bacterium]|nr:FAD-dependent oxidoreductase [Desulfovibrionales bacterium]MDQ7838640.1 FAD-dependent oxidoreductase [Thermodesulfobacteriota bacterium]
MTSIPQPKVGSVLVIGGGIAGVQAALDLAESGFFVYLVERSAAIGGVMAQLDKTFPTNDCSMCILSPKLVECGRHLNIEILTLSEVKEVSGTAGRFKVRIVRHPRYIDETKCIACGTCAEKCPKKVKDEFNAGLAVRKAAYIQYPQAVPLKYAIDPVNCIWLNKPGRCGACAKYCPTQAVDLTQTDREVTFEVGSIVVATGCGLSQGTVFQYANSPNVVTSVEFERILSATGPYRGHLVRPSDGNPPKKIAWLQCVGSRDRTNRYCSAVCCMYAIKEAVIAKEHSAEPLDTAIFFMDMRTSGKDFDKYYRRAEEESGVRFIRSRIQNISPLEDGGLLLRYATEDGRISAEPFDMVVLSVGLKPAPDMVDLSERLDVDVDQYGFVATGDLSPVAASRPGIYVCGASEGPKDIPQSVMEASAAACGASTLLSEVRHTMSQEKSYPAELDVTGEEPQVGVFVCHCGINIGGVIDVEGVRAYAGSLPGVAYVESNLFTCSQDTQEKMKAVIKEHGLNRVVVASCSPRTHEPIFQQTLREAGLNKFLFELVNIRDQGSWVHRSEPEAATEKAKDLIRMAVAKMRLAEALPGMKLPASRDVLVVGGGVAGMVSALELADQGHTVHLVERDQYLGGQATSLRRTWQGEDIQSYVAGLVEAVTAHERVQVYLQTTIKNVTGSVGNFETTVVSGGDGSTRKIEHGAAILATGAGPARTEEYLAGQDPNVYQGVELDQVIAREPGRIKQAQSAVFIQCVGSRDEHRPYCSRICCTHSTANALELKRLNPKIEVYILYRDVRTYGKREDLYRQAREQGVIFLRYDPADKPRVESVTGAGGAARLKVAVTDRLLGETLEIYPDFVSLATAIESTGQKKLAEMFKVPVNDDGFFIEAHMKLRPVDLTTEGVFVCGMAHYPKPMEESIAQAKAAAGRAGALLAKGCREIEGVVASVSPDLCVSCLTCVRLCPYHVPAINAEGKAEIDPASCQGCGICVAECPAKAISFKYLTDKQVIAGCRALLRKAAG